MRGVQASKYLELHKFWLHQLILEFESICENYDVELHPPVFEISQSRKKLGEWNPATRSISLSQHLILNYPWSTTLHVLKHEMAHQLCSVHFRSEDRPHGEDFKRACEILGLPVEYRAAQADLQRVVDVESRGNREVSKGRRIQQKVVKLLALSESGNEHEAALALEKAQDLVRKYHLDADSTGDQANLSFVVIDKKRKRLASFQKSICMILSEFFLVRVVISERYDPLVNDTFKVIELLGSREKLVIAEYCYFYLENQLELLWEANKIRFRHGNKRTQRNSYYLGVLHGFYSHLGLDREKKPEGRVSPEKKELVQLSETLLNEYVHMRFPRLSKTSRRKMKVKRDVYEDGLKSGKEMTFAQGLSGNRTAMLENS